MTRDRFQSLVESLLNRAGIAVNGQHPWDIHVHDPRFYRRVITQGSVGLGDTYMEGWWDCERLDECVARLIQADLDKHAARNWRAWAQSLPQILFNPQKLAKAFEIGRSHYDIGNEFYRVLLDKRMTYTCAYWKNAETLDQAQEHKLDLVCRKIGLKPGMSVLDIGCGWGSFIGYAAQHYGVSAVGVTVSQNQVDFAREACQGLPVEIYYQDYRTMQGQYDRVVSLGMFEHVGYKNYRLFMQVVRRHLKDDGLFLLHSIGGNVSKRAIDSWIDKHIFPNAMLPSIAQIGRAIEPIFVMEDWHNFGADYDKTLMAWFNNLNTHWPSLSQSYNNRFYRMLTFYLLSCAASFRVRKNQLWQIVLSKNGVPGGYESIR